MNINTNKLASNSNAFLKKLKDIGSTSKSDKKDNQISKKLKNDFFDIKFNDKSFKSRIVNNNKRLSRYEYDMTKLQFLQTKTQELENFFQSTS